MPVFRQTLRVWTARTQTIINQVASATPLIIRAASSQSADLFVVENSSQTDLLSVNSSGLLKALASAEVTGSLTVNTHEVTRTISQTGNFASIGNTTTETSLWSFTVPANSLDTNRSIRVRVFGDYTNSSGSNKTIRVAIQYGSTTLFNGTTGNIGSQTASRAWNLDFSIAAANSSSSQILGGVFSVSVQDSASDAGTGNFASADSITQRTFTGSSSEASNVDKTLDITIAHSQTASSGTLEMNRLYAVAVLE